ncbi:hypothetical protein J1614_011693 [Plenodomus biglobosus]|nr:hypothetical protein J1614_011693 [Plenodomus biglobosus]
MSGHRDAERHPPSAWRNSHEWSDEEDEENDYSYSAVFSSSSPYRATSAGAGMPSPERNRYSNKESAKVNAGFYMGALDQDECEDDDPKNVVTAFASGAPAVDIDFSQLVIPVVAPEPPPTAEQHVRRLLHPPPHAFPHGVLSIQWAIGAGGGLRHFVFRNSDERYILKPDSELRTRGAELGLPGLYLEWLCGNDESITAVEQGMYLTPEFF